MVSLLTLLNALALIIQTLASPPSCFSCSSMSHARYCDYYTKCSDGEVCYVKKSENYNGHFHYTSGCVSNTTCGTFVPNVTSGLRYSSHGHDVCRECCYSDMCNNKGCGDNGPPPRQDRGPYCFQCEHLSDPSECDQVTICNINEVCGVEEKEFFQQEHQFTTGCKRKSECHESLLVGRAMNSSVRSLNMCDQCCESDFCNDRCGESQAKVYGSCDDHYRAGSVTSGVYTISPDDVNTFDVYCDMENGDGGWIVLQHRFDNSVLFNRSFAEYENGFGQLDGEFWIGLEKIYILAHSSRKVRFNLQALNGTWLPLEYGNFSISNASQQYTLHVSNHIQGFSAQSFEYNNGQVFSTYDKDHRGCAAMRFGGFWYDHCLLLNINGHFGLLNDASGVLEYTNGSINFQKTLMMIH
ncbi:angiopoietin-1-like [Mizuhopecten yessoensis]|uniref:Fibroleukin n=1 Tax=Mizuhopecten yessoensis TaxID=6573 RepID=A0A210Q0N8_MIZYE|nr:angiopoietin-1-like [Mizuhopecten yessoensis]OWF42275.1 Fibroleukin [Mizuhopecten yessoensis]